MKKLTVGLLAVLISGCATMPYEPYAREVKKKPRQGGVIALKPVHRTEDRVRADVLMAANCGTEANVNVSEEGEVVVGEKTNSSSNKVQETRSDSFFRIGALSLGSGSRPGENTQTQSETVQMKEWQISYECVALDQKALSGKGKKISRR